MKFTEHIVQQLLQPDGGEVRTSSVTEALTFCRTLAQSHYENFPVGSLLLPKHLREATYVVYVFARLGDSIADELQHIPKEQRAEMLRTLAAFLHSPQQGNPLSMALHYVRTKFSLPSSPFERLLEAFRRDIYFTQPTTWADIEEYCHYSANPVGELVLRLHGYYSAAILPYSDAICTGLQCINFWQDISRDSNIGRCYIPLVELQKYGLTTENLLNSEKTVNLRGLEECVTTLIQTTKRYFEHGALLLPHIPSVRLRTELAVIRRGGMRIIEKVSMLGTHIITQRPSVGVSDIPLLGVRACYDIIHSYMFGKGSRNNDITH